MKRRKALALFCVVAIAIVISAVFAPVVSLEADIPGSGGIFTTTTTYANTTSTLTEVATPGFDRGLGSITFCYFGQGALLIQGAYYPLTKPTLQIVGAFCPALRAEGSGP